MKRLAFIAGLFLAQGAWASFSGYSNKRQVTITSAQVSGAQTNFPVVFVSTDIWFSTSTSGGKEVNANGYDLIASTLSDCSLALNVDTETVNSGVLGSTFTAWVQIPLIDTNTVGTLSYYWCAGNSSITSYQGNSKLAWDSGFKVVGHALNPAAPQDSTANGCNGVTSGVISISTGQIASAGDFTPTNSNILMGGTTCGSAGSGTPGTLDFTTFTYHAWINPTSSNTEDIYNGGASSMIQFRRDSTNQLSLNIYNTGSYVVGTGSVSNGVWTQVDTTFDGVNQWAFYINGVLDSSGTKTIPAQWLVSNWRFVNHTWRFGFGNGTPRMYIDEGEVSNVVRSPGWILTEYNNQSAPQTFQTLGPDIPSTTAPPALFFGSEM